MKNKVLNAIRTNVKATSAAGAFRSAKKAPSSNAANRFIATASGQKTAGQRMKGE